MYQALGNFVIIDDDSCHNIVCALSIKKALKPFNINITGFTNAAEGIQYLENHLSNSLQKTILLLDINMPVLSGWDALARIEAMPAAIKKNLVVYMLSSFVKASDKAKAFTFSCVNDCIEKPLSDHLIRITEELAETILLKKISA